MNKTKITEPLHIQSGEAQNPGCSQLARLDGELYNKIENSHLLPEFMMSLTSSSNHWMFVSSFGALTAGRRISDNALFPYYSADKIMDTRKQTAPLTVIKLVHGGQQKLWRPFWDAQIDSSQVRRNLYKSPLGNKLCFEEINLEMGIAFRYRWTFSHQFGFVRSSKIINFGNKDCLIDLVDGVQNIVPYGVNESFQLQFGNLVDAYKKNELSDTGIGLFYLSSIPTDRAEPSEGLRATIAWATRPPINTLLSNVQLNQFIANTPIQTETDIRARRGDYLLNYQFELKEGEEAEWEIVADVEFDQTDVVHLSAKIGAETIKEDLKADVQDCENRLAELIAKSDGFQVSKRFGKSLRHQANVMYNVMRGGVPADDYKICTTDFKKHIANANREVASRNQQALSGLTGTVTRSALIELAKNENDNHFLRIVMEYLPLVFSRRHGDPTRPWNKFSINSHLAGEERSFDYQGNWRDIFQNWEALAFSYPQFVEGMICRFLNATTADGYNPYRITKNGFEWESPEPENPWANIGYWCDHQIIYLCKLLELSRQFFPGQIDRLWNEDIFVYANVPYRIKSHEEILKDPRNTVEFDRELSNRTELEAASMGNDAKLLNDANGDIQMATLAEKLLVPFLVKMSNFVPDGGVWLNTQRPEWNDANNALVGYGLSVVTTGYMRRYLGVIVDWVKDCNVNEFNISEDILWLLSRIELAISPYVEEGDTRITAEQRQQIMGDLSKAGSRYRERIYERGLSGERNSVSRDAIIDFLLACRQMIDNTLKSNRRSDGLFHCYNLMSLDVEGEVQIERLYEMLEGQVAVLSSGYLNPREAVALLDKLKSSALYRQDQQSYMLYPNRELPRFMEKNLVPAGLINQSPLLLKLLKDGDENIIRKDIFGNCHFNGDFRNGKDVADAIQKFDADGKYKDLLTGASEQIASIFENVFCHHQFTGRSGTFFAYEGLGSIYWHMVSKLLLAVSENYLMAEESGQTEVAEALEIHFREIQFGLGAEKSPLIYGAFPSDPYSHTPEHAGAQQPGMTGQVKEDILSRFTEVGVRVKNGQVHFDAGMLDPSEFSAEVNELPVWNFAKSKLEIIKFDAQSFVFTLCGVQVQYSIGNESKMTVRYTDGNVESSKNCVLTCEQSAHIFARDGKIASIELQIVSD